MILNNVQLTELRRSAAALHLSRRDTTVATRCMLGLVVHLRADELQNVSILFDLLFKLIYIFKLIIKYENKRHLKMFNKYLLLMKLHLV